MDHRTVSNPIPPVAKLRTDAAAHHVGLAPATLVKMRCVGGGPLFTRLGRAVVYELGDLEAWVAAQGKHRSTAEVVSAR